ncbi:MAG: PxKF domain-containing protein [Chloroflexota bacterium]
MTPPKDSVIAAGRRLGVTIISSDNEYTVRPAAGTQLSVDLAKSSVQIPIVGGAQALAEAMGITAPEIGYTISCSTGRPTGTITSTPGSPSISYSASSCQYSYSWLTIKKSGICGELLVTLNDGTLHTLRYKLTK